jgi:hypothetical protein
VTCGTPVKRRCGSCFQARFRWQRAAGHRPWQFLVHTDTVSSCAPVERPPSEGGAVWGGARNVVDGLIDDQSFDFWFDFKLKGPGWLVKKYRQQSPTIANSEGRVARAYACWW